MKRKECFKCKARKPLTSFYKHPQMADGRVNKCKECNKKDVQENRAMKIEFYQAYDKDRAMKPHRIALRAAYIKTDNGKESMARSRKKYTTKHPDRYKANYAVGNAVRDGRLTREPCEICGSTYRIHGHHDDYSKPLDVRWLCRSHHAQVHGRN